MLQLGAREPGLDLAVPVGVRLGEPLLPAPAATAGSPHEQLPAAQHVGGRLHQPAPVGVEGGDPAAPDVGQLVEVVSGVRAVERVAAVDSLVRRHGYPAQTPLVSEVPGLPRRRQHSALLRNCDVGPPVGRHGPLVRIADADTDVQEVGVLRQPEVDLEGQVAQAFPLPQAEHLAAVGGGDAGRVQRGAGEGGVAGGADVPFDAAGVPGAVEGEVGGLEHRVAVKEFAAGRLVQERGDAAPESGQYGGAQPVVLDHQGVDLPGFARPPVSVPHAYRQQAVQWCEADLPGHVPRQLVPVPVLDAVHLVEHPQRRQRVVRTRLGGGQGEYLTSDGRHDHHGSRSPVS